VISTFQGTKINANYASLSIEVQCMIHKCNLAFKTLFNLGITNSIENLLQSCHFSFLPTQKKHLRFTKLINMMETKGPKILMNVKTQWISLLELLCNLKNIYVTFLAKMSKDMINNQVIKVPYYLFLSIIVGFYVVAIYFKSNFY
jgi:hypothetical protein